MSAIEDKTTMRCELRRAFGTGTLLGVLFGLREGLSTFATNAYADATHYAAAYLLVPVAVWVVVGPLLLVPVALCRRWTGGLGVPSYAGLLGGIGTLVSLLAIVDGSLREMIDAGGAPNIALRATLVSLALLGALVAACVLRAATAWHARQGATLLRGATRIAIVVGIVSIGWTAHFLGTTLASSDDAGVSTVDAPPPPAEAPNVVLISVDTLRADELGAYGASGGRTPALDRVAAEGVTFEQAISPAPWTLPSLASLMTGLYPRHHGAGGVVNQQDPLGRSPLAPATSTLAEAFSRSGYRTHAIVTNPYLLARSGLARGYQGYENLTFLSEAMIAGGNNAPQWLLDRLAPTLVVGDRGIEVSDRAVRWLAATDAQRPFFLWLHYLDPHGPYGGGDHERHKSFRGETSFGARRSGGVRSPDPVRMRSGEIRLGSDEKAATRALYRTEIVEVDRQIGRVLDALDARGLRDRSIVVVVSDHGEEFWEHGGVEHGHTLYDEVLRVVLLVRWPQELPAGRRIASVVSTIDVAPTLVDLAGVSTSAPSDGRSLRDIVHGVAPSRAVLSENLLFAEERVALRTDTAKLVRWANGKEEAYDLVRDPLERRDLAGVESFVGPLRTALADLETNMAPAVAPMASSRIPAGALRALGYLQ